MSFNLTQVSKLCVTPKLNRGLVKWGGSRVTIFEEHRAEMIYTAFVKVGFCNLKCVLKSLMYVKMGGEQQEYDKIDAQ